MTQWLYRYVFRGLGVVMLIGMITILLVAVASQTRRAPQAAHGASAGVSR